MLASAGTLDYMAPEVLINPCTRLEERDATMQQLDARNIVPYTTKVDVWATGVLAYELVTGHPPFEVDDESETVRLILTSDDYSLPSCYSPEWASFVRCACDRGWDLFVCPVSDSEWHACAARARWPAHDMHTGDGMHEAYRTVLTKKARKRPPASALLEHPWIVKNMARAVHSSRAPELERLLEPIQVHKAGPDGAQESLLGASAAETEGSPIAQLPGAGALLAKDDREASAPPHASSLGSQRTIGGKGAVSFTVPADSLSCAPVHPLSAEEKSETGAAIGMRARLQLYMNRQRLGEPQQWPTRASSL
jgi:serine/threonine protein kinase